MKLRVKRSDLLDFAIMWLMLLQVMILRWFNLTSYVNRILLVLFAFKIITSYKGFIKQRSLMWYLIILVYFLASYALYGGDKYILFKNFYETSTPILILIYFCYLMLCKRNFFYDFIRSLFIPLNLYTLINIPVILLQISGQTWLAGFSSFTNTYYIDLISGLLGFNGTPMLAMYSSFAIIYNYGYATFWASRKNRFPIIVYNALIMLFFLVVSMINGNNGFYLVLLMEIVLYYVTVNEAKVREKKIGKKIWNLIKKVLPFLIAACVVVFILYKTTAIGTSINRTIHEFQVGITYMNSASGSNERIGMIAYALTNPELRLTGNGLATYTWTSEYAFGFKHYGQSDIGTFMCLGGLVLVVLVCVLAFSALRRAFPKSYLSAMFLAMVIIVAIYTQVFTVTSLMISTMMFFATCWCVREENAQQGSVEQQRDRGIGLKLF